MEKLITSMNNLNKALKALNCSVEGTSDMFNHFCSKIEVEDKLTHLQNYMSLRIDLISKDPDKWLGAWLNQIFTFDYYMEHCVINKGGAYDFTKRSFKSRKITLDKFYTNQFKKVDLKQKEVFRQLKYSMWMGTAFNEKEFITTT